MTNPKVFRQRHETEKIVLDGLIHFMKRSGMSTPQINRVMKGMPHFELAFKTALLKVLSESGLQLEDALRITGAIPKADQRQVLAATAAKL